MDAGIKALSSIELKEKYNTNRKKPRLRAKDITGIHVLIPQEGQTKGPVVIINLGARAVSTLSNVPEVMEALRVGIGDEKARKTPVAVGYRCGPDYQGKKTNFFKGNLAGFFAVENYALKALSIARRKRSPDVQPYISFEFKEEHNQGRFDGDITACKDLLACEGYGIP